MTPEAQRAEHIRALEAFAQLAMGASTKAALLAGADALRQQTDQEKDDARSDPPQPGSCDADPRGDDPGGSMR